MVFRAKGARTFKCRVTDDTGRTGLRSTGRRFVEEAEDVERTVRAWEGRGPSGQRAANPTALRAIMDRRLSLARAYNAALDGVLPAVLAALPPADPAPLVRSLVGQFVAARGDRYQRQLEILLPEDWRLPQLTKGNVAAQLAGLDVANPTKNRYRAAVSQFVAFLVERDIMDTNFVRDIRGFGERPPRIHRYAGEDAERVIAALPQPWAAVSAFALMFCAEWAAIERLRVGDVEQGREGPFPIRAHVRGTKTGTRDRFVPLVPEFAAYWRYFAPALAEKHPDALVFAGLVNQRALKAQQRAAKALGLDPAHTLHDWRHDHTVRLLQAGYAPAVAAAHLGHANTVLVHKVYGRWIVTEADYSRARSATNPATTARNHMKSGGASA